MKEINRRGFLQLSTGALVSAASRKLLGEPETPSISNRDGTVVVKGAHYSWQYSAGDDRFQLRDAKGRTIVEGTMQPAVVVALPTDPSARRCTAGMAKIPKVDAGRVSVDYEGVNGSSKIKITWRFDQHGIWTGPIVYEAAAAEDVVSVHYFALASADKPLPTLHTGVFIAPGLLSGSAVSPIVREFVHLDESVWLGRGSFIPGLNQQWGLPVHYFAGFNTTEIKGARNLFTEGRSDAFACGLADLPGGDLFLQLHEGNSSLWIDYRGDLWKHMRGPGALMLGATLFWSIAPDYYDAIAAYYHGLLQSGIIHRHQNSEHKTAVALTPQFCTWGVQVDRDMRGDHMGEGFLTGLYEELKASGMKAGLFSIDDKWEGTYGKLEHSEKRLPNFEKFLDQVRADGYKIGIWAALMRCEQPSDLGLTVDQMLKKPDGTPYIADFSHLHYYILDFTQPAVAKVLDGLARRFIRRYKPDLVKFDFGYELPAVGIASPLDKSWTGEKLMKKGLDVVITAMREENPDLVVMYYNLSPLFLDYFDLHSPDDLYQSAGEYELEANRRFFFSSLMGPLGIPTYGSSGYDWASSPGIWFDSAAVGTIGSLNDFQGDEQGESSTPELIARYNGMTKVLRTTDTFEVLPLDTISLAPTLGAHARSWARFEGGELVLLAYRPTIPGDENPLRLASISDPRVKGAIQSRVPVVVASKGKAGISRSNSLAAVAYGPGEITIRREAGNHAEVRNHFFGGNSTTTTTKIEQGQLKLTAPQTDAAGKPLEWIQILIS